MPQAGNLGNSSPFVEVGLKKAEELTSVTIVAALYVGA